MDAVREVLWEMREEGEVEVLQGGKVLGSLEGVRGPVRVRYRKGEEGGGRGVME